MTFKEQIETYLAPLPSEWKKKLTTILCEINASQQTVDCQDVKNCETLTAFSDFEVDGTEISIQYRDEKGVTVTRTIDISSVLDSILDGLEPGCLADETTWQNLTLAEKLQLLIDSHCNCCDEGVSLRMFSTEFGNEAPYDGFIALHIDDLRIGNGVTFANNTPIATIVSNLNTQYEDFAEFVVNGTAIQVTMLTDNYQGITLQYFQQFS